MKERNNVLISTYSTCTQWGDEVTQPPTYTQQPVQIKIMALVSACRQTPSSVSVSRCCPTGRLASRLQSQHMAILEIILYGVLEWPSYQMENRDICVRLCVCVVEGLWNLSNYTPDVKECVCVSVQKAGGSFLISHMSRFQKDAITPMCSHETILWANNSVKSENESVAFLMIHLVGHGFNSY